MNESSIYSVRPSSSRDVTQIETRTLRNRFTPTTKIIFVLSISPDFYTSVLLNFINSKKVRLKTLFSVSNWVKPIYAGKCSKSTFLTFLTSQE